MFKSKLTPLCLAGLTLSLTACSGTEEIIEDIVETLTKKEQYIHGVAIDGYLSNAKVCLDVNGDLACTDADGAIAITNTQGQYKLAVGQNTLDGKQILVQAIAGHTIDMDRPSEPVAASFTYTGPAKDNAVVSPMSSIINAIAAQKGVSQSQAEQEVAAAIGVTSDELSQDFVSANTQESKQIHALAQALTRLMQELHKVAEIGDNKALFNKLLSKISLSDLKAITDKPLQANGSDVNALEALNNEAANAIGSFIADFIANSANNGDITSTVTPKISDELQSAYDEFNRLVSATNTDLANLPNLQQAYNDSLSAYSTSVNEYQQCLLQLCSELANKQQAVVSAITEVKAKIAAIQRAVVDIKEKVNRINLSYGQLVSDLTKAGDLEKVKVLLNLRLGVLSNFTSQVNEEPTALPDVDGDGVVDALDAFPNDKFESKDENNNQVGDNAEAVTSDFNAFTLDLFKTQAGQSNEQTMVLSPFSVAQALSMTLAGAKEQTALELGNVLNLQQQEHLSDSDKLAFFTSDELLGHIRSMNNYLSQKDTADTSSFKSANGFWMSHTYDVKQAYTQRLTDYFTSQVKKQDFSDANAVAKDVNTWVAQNTNNEIDSIIQPSDIDSLTRAILANAVYFKAGWVSAFDPEMTKTSAFYSQPSGFLQQKNLPMMEQVLQTQYYQGFIGNVGVTAVDLDYGSAQTDTQAGYSRYSMTLILPNVSYEASLSNYQFAGQGALSLDPLQNALTWANLEPFLAQLDAALILKDTQVRLPKFKIETEIDGIEVLKAMGVKAPFDANADFSGMSDEAVQIDKIKHKATIEVEEQGTVASGATAVVVGGRSLSYPNEFNANRPFIYLVRDNKLNSILFLGKYSG